jgi:hypothetical protein
MKTAHGSTVSHTVYYRTDTNAPCRNRTYNLMIKSQNPSILAPLGNLALPSIEGVSLVQRRGGEDAPNFHAFSHARSVVVSPVPPDNKGGGR